jgi:hypothetical protein
MKNFKFVRELEKINIFEIYFLIDFENFFYDFFENYPNFITKN